ncbi:MAG: c-type cytochrome [Acidobacteria bacterium]|nr:c-type cytochrome [Acidobacteriota bacterium]
MRWAAVGLLGACALAQRLPRDPAALETGRQIYQGSCSGCHGATGEGSQGPSLLSGRAARVTNQQLVATLRNGLPGTTMPGFPMADDKLLAVAGYVRSLTTTAINVATAGNAGRGRELFFGAARCASCHMIRGVGGHPGPDLSNIAAERTLHQIRESILLPSARIAAGYRAGTVKTRAGETLSGVIRNHNNYATQLLDPRGELHSLDAAAVQSVRIDDARSLMPPLANPADAVDLVAFLARQSLRPPAEGDKP